ncbi:MAG: hypothetical protein A2V70_09125 [Planctomycetes bacterium RBG_13_63_9]|nr:MAG: hypothetical protein A2V70_09125 [Planctomycetes bacterium RBG_13_63_9]
MRAILEQHVPRVYGFALRLTGNPDMAEDLTQETFLRAWRHRRRLREPRAARVWLFQIAVNLWRDRARRERRRPAHVELSDDDCPSAAARPEQAAGDREDVGRALRAMDSLPPRQREVLYLHALEQLSLEQIAEVLAISSDAVKASLSLARKRMRRQLRDICRDRFPTT